MPRACVPALREALRPNEPFSLGEAFNRSALSFVVGVLVGANVGRSAASLPLPTGAASLADGLAAFEQEAKLIGKIDLLAPLLSPGQSSNPYPGINSASYITHLVVTASFTLERVPESSGSAPNFCSINNVVFHALFWSSKDNARLPRKVTKVHPRLNATRVICTSGWLVTAIEYVLALEGRLRHVPRGARHPIENVVPPILASPFSPVIKIDAALLQIAD